jgi:hypothetical protein
VSVKKYVSDEEIDNYFAKLGLTKEQAAANLKRRYPKANDEWIQNELQVGPLCEQVLEAFKVLAKKRPDLLWSDEPFFELRM